VEALLLMVLGYVRGLLLSRAMLAWVKARAQADFQLVFFDGMTRLRANPIHGSLGAGTYCRRVTRLAGHDGYLTALARSPGTCVLAQLI
jgi:hypothetical protein